MQREKRGRGNRAGKRKKWREKKIKKGEKSLGREEEMWGKFSGSPPFELWEVKGASGNIAIFLSFVCLCTETLLRCNRRWQSGGGGKEPQLA